MVRYLTLVGGGEGNNVHLILAGKLYRGKMSAGAAKAIFGTIEPGTRVALTTERGTEKDLKRVFHYEVVGDVAYLKQGLKPLGRVSERVAQVILGTNYPQVGMAVKVRVMQPGDDVLVVTPRLDRAQGQLTCPQCQETVPMPRFGSFCPSCGVDFTAPVEG